MRTEFHHPAGNGRAVGERGEYGKTVSRDHQERFKRSPGGAGAPRLPRALHIATVALDEAKHTLGRGSRIVRPGIFQRAGPSADLAFLWPDLRRLEGEMQILREKVAPFRLRDIRRPQ